MPRLLITSPALITSLLLMFQDYASRRYAAALMPPRFRAFDFTLDAAILYACSFDAMLAHAFHDDAYFTLMRGR